MMYELIAPCHFGLESVLKNEITRLGYDILQVEDGRVIFACDEEGIARSNIGLRTCERLMIKAGSFHAETFDELFEGIKAIEWDRYIPENGRFWVKKASSVKSRLFSPSDIQSIVKKAIVEKLRLKYGVSWFSEDGADYPLRVFINKDEVMVGIDTSGDSLHKRGYRAIASEAPISETLAAALIMLTPWNRDRILVDPFCGSGTFCIEAAMMAANIAPGISRNFLCQEWENIIPKRSWYNAISEANDVINTNIDTDIQGYDIDDRVIRIARNNADTAGVKGLIHFQQREVKNLSHPKKYGFIITNPPYGERLEDAATLPAIYRSFGEQYRKLDSWSAFMITSYENAQKDFGMTASRNRKIYNGMIKTYFYSYLGPKPASGRRTPNSDSTKTAIGGN
ncbi:MAG: class I SAM-dependent RNA methyltransferase [Parasporobacterium sp.]|nr:class I SAM-dependent RNA methyltransferase [Parasporobacterium sp.]